MSKVLENLIPTVKSKDTKTTVLDTKKTSNKSELKSASSLFDTMLQAGLKKSSDKKNIKNQKSITPSDTKIKTTNEKQQALQTYKNSVGNTNNTNLIKQKIQEIKIDTKAENKTSSKTTGSLMDSLVSDATKSIKEQDTKQIKSEKPNLEIKKELKTNIKQNTDKSVKITEQKDEPKSKIIIKENSKQKIQEIKIDTKVENKTSLKVNILSNDITNDLDDLINQSQSKLNIAMSDVDNKSKIKQNLTEKKDDITNKINAVNSRKDIELDTKNTNDKIKISQNKKVEVLSQDLDEKQILVQNIDFDDNEQNIQLKKEKTENKKLFTKVETEKNIESKIDSLIVNTNNIQVNDIVKTKLDPINKDIKVSTKNDKPLVDKLPDDSLDQVKQKNSEINIEPKQVVNQDKIVINTKEPLFANMYMGTQKHIKDLANMQQKQEGLKQAKEGKTVEDIEKSATTLELNPSEAKVTTKVNNKVEQPNMKNTSNEKMLDKLAFSQNVLHEDLNNIDDEIVTTSKQTIQSIHNKEVQKVNSVEITVAPQVVQTIQNKIIGAKQYMSQMMSDIARQMVENYRPPVTAFRINLNPNGLGNIAVMMKTDKQNGLKISLNMSNSNTKDALVDNQTALRSALARNFETNTQFTLEFSMQDNSDNQNQSNFNQQSNQNNSSKQEQTTNIDELKTIETEDNINSDYM